jgi:pimeloyl-ACP methyl ester carboxylesterase
LDETLLIDAWAQGHSNGGQGAWYLGTHFPDRAVAVFAAAGYTKIQDYVPFTSWIGGSHSDPWLRGVKLCSYIEKLPEWQQQC